MALGRLRGCAFAILVAACGYDPGMAGRAGTALEGICAEVQCRPPTVVHLSGSDIRRMVIPTVPGPYVHEGRISILEGESFRVEPVIDGPTLVDLRYFDEPLSPRRTFFVEFERRGASSVLDFENPFSRHVLFRDSADSTSPNWDAPSRICIIGPGQSRSMAWDPETRGLVIHDLRIVDGQVGVPVGCE